MKNKYTKSGITPRAIGKMSAEELQQNIEKFAKRVNQRISDIQKYGDQQGLDMAPVIQAARKTLGAEKASRSKIKSVAEGRWRLRKILDTYSMSGLTRTGQKQAFKNRKTQYQWVMGKTITQAQAHRLDNILGGLEIRKFGSDTWVELGQMYSKNDAFNGDTDAFLDWLDGKHINVLDDYAELINSDEDFYNGEDVF